MRDPGSATRLRSRGLRVTAPRLAVLAELEAAAERHEHLTVAEVIMRAGAALGTLSKQATYDCLEALSSAGLARKIEPAGQPALYESRVGDNHHHLVCRDCGAVADLECDIGAAPCVIPPETGGFVVDEAEVVFWGRCAACARAADARSTTRHLPPTERNDR